MMFFHYTCTNTSNVEGKSDFALYNILIQLYTLKLCVHSIPSSVEFIL